MRADSAAAALAFLAHLGEAGVEFSVSARLNDQIRAPIRVAQSRADAWTPAVRHDGQLRDGAHVTEITRLVDLSGYEGLDRPGGFARSGLLAPLQERDFRLLWAA